MFPLRVLRRRKLNKVLGPVNLKNEALYAVIFIPSYQLEESVGLESGTEN